MKTTTHRIEALDVFRALTMFFMLFVNDIPGLKNVPHWLFHAAPNEDMLGFSDTIFPGFLFALGMAIPFAIENRIKKGDTRLQVAMHIFWRTVALLVMGVFTVNRDTLDPGATGMSNPVFSLLMVLAFFLIWSVYPKADNKRKYLFLAMKGLGILILTYLFYIYKGEEGAAFSTSWWGILGLIGWTYVVCAGIYLFTRKNLVWNSLAMLALIGCSLLSAAGIAEYIPIVGYMPASATLFAFGMTGLWASLLLQRLADKKNPQRFYRVMGGIGLLMLIAALFAHPHWIISKLQDTPTWYFYCCAIFFPLFAFIFWLTDIKEKKHWFALIKPAGTVTLTCYVIPYAWYSVRSLLGVSYPDWMMSGAPGLIKSLILSFLVIALAWLLSKLKIRLKI